MDIALQLFNDAVERLKFGHKSPLLNEKIKLSLGEAYSPHLAFRVKQEILRKARLSRRSLQINEWIPKLDATPYMVDGVCHYLDPMSYSLFKKLYDAYGQHYTVDVEESVIAYIKHKKQDILNLQANKEIRVEYLQLSDNAYRKEERMHLAIRVHVDKVDCEVHKTTLFKKNDMINATESLTSNISLSGLKIKHESEGEIGKIYAVRFTGWESEFVMPSNPVLYRLVKQEELEDQTGEFTFSWYLVMLENEHHAQFSLFLSKTIQANRLRYRVDVHNVERSILNGVAEQFIINREEGLTLFLDKNKKVKYILGNSVGQAFYESFSFDNKDTLLYLLARDNVYSAEPGDRFFFCGFTQRNGVHFWARLNQKEPLSELFFQYVASRPDAKLFQLDVLSPNKDNAFYSHNVPADVVGRMRSTRLKRSVNEYGDDVRMEVIGLEKMLSITPLDPRLMLSLYPSVGKVDEVSTVEFKKFALMKTVLHDVPFVRVKNHELRRQDRYIVNTRAIVASSGIEAQVDNVSLAGICLSLSSPKLFQIGALVTLDFPELPAINNLPPQASYKVVYSDNSTLRLAGEIDGDLVERRYWSAFFDKHAASLELCGVSSEKENVGLERSLRNIVRASHTSLHALFSVKGSRVAVNYVNRPFFSGSESMFEIEEDQAKPSDFYKTLFCNMELQDYLSAELRKINKESPFSRSVIAVCYESKPMLPKRVVAVKVFNSPFSSVHQLSTFAKLMSAKGAKVAYFHLSITRKSRVFDRYYADEMSYVSNVAVHKAEALRAVVSSTSGVVKLTPLKSWIDTCELIEQRQNSLSDVSLSG